MILRAVGIVATTGCTLLALVPLTANMAQESAVTRRTFSSGYRFVEMTGEELFAIVCQGCHMPNGFGAVGAGTYPPLASNRNLEVSGYAVDLIVKRPARNAGFGDMMTDGQVAAVVNYVRTHFGNRYPDAVSAADVKDARR